MSDPDNGPEHFNEIMDFLLADISDSEEFYNSKPLLAHYTSIDTLEVILKSEEIWLSNPLFMNDYEEIRFGIVTGTQEFKASEPLRRAIGSDERYSNFIFHLDRLIAEFEEKHLLDTYIFCLSQHTPNDNDGLLSMWRGYGGNGKGAAIVFDTAQLDVINDDRLILSSVKYETRENRLLWLKSKAEALATHILLIPDVAVWLVAYCIFERLKIFALFTKHRGFSEEREWRLVYMPDRDGTIFFEPHYYNGPRGVEPKMKFKIEPSGSLASDFCLEKIIHKILIGPSVSSPLSLRSIERMFEIINRAALKDKLVSSTIPYRS